MIEISLKKLSEKETFEKILEVLKKEKEIEAIRLGLCYISAPCACTIFSNSCKELTLRGCTIDSKVPNDLLEKLIAKNESLKTFHYEVHGRDFIEIAQKLNIFHNAFLENKAALNKLTFKTSYKDFVIDFKFIKNDSRTFLNVYIDAKMICYKKSSNECIKIINMINTNINGNFIKKFRLVPEIVLNEDVFNSLYNLYNMHSACLERFEAFHFMEFYRHGGFSEYDFVKDGFSEIDKKLRFFNEIFLKNKQKSNTLLFKFNTKYFYIDVELINSDKEESSVKILMTFNNDYDVKSDGNNSPVWAEFINIVNMVNTVFTRNSIKSFSLEKRYGPYEFYLNSESYNTLINLYNNNKDCLEVFNCCAYGVKLGEGFLDFFANQENFSNTLKKLGAVLESTEQLNFIKSFILCESNKINEMDLCFTVKQHPDFKELATAQNNAMKNNKLVIITCSKRGYHLDEFDSNNKIIEKVISEQRFRCTKNAKYKFNPY